jgi:hypothetical protein
MFILFLVIGLIILIIILLSIIICLRKKIIRSSKDKSSGFGITEIADLVKQDMSKVTFKSEKDVIKGQKLSNINDSFKIDVLKTPKLKRYTETLNSSQPKNLRINKTSINLECGINNLKIAKLIKFEKNMTSQKHIN